MGEIILVNAWAGRGGRTGVVFQGYLACCRFQLQFASHHFTMGPKKTPTAAKGDGSTTRTRKVSGASSSAKAAPAATAGSKRPREEKAAIVKSAAPSTASSSSKKVKSSDGGAAAAAAAPQPKSILKKTPAASKAAPPAASKGKKAVTTTTMAPPPKAAKAAAPRGASSSKSASKSPLTSQKPVVSEDEEEDDEDDEDEESLDSDEEAEMLKGMTSDEDDEGEDSDDDANSSDEEAEDSAALKKHREIETLKLPSSKDEAAVKERLEKLAKRRSSAPSQNVDTAVLFVGHLPKHFTEGPLRAYFSQFGTITRLRLSRNKKTGASKHYGFLEFADEEVAKIVQETMDNYLILGQLLKVKAMDKDEIHPKLWVGANRAFRKVPEGRLARIQHDGPKTAEQKERVERRLLKKEDKKRKALKEAGYDYDFDGYGKGEGKNKKAVAA